MSTLRSLAALLVLAASCHPEVTGASGGGQTQPPPPVARVRELRPVNVQSVLAAADDRVGKGGGSWNPPQIAESGEKEDKTLSPYFFIPGADGTTEKLPLKETSADITIAGVIARVRVHQVFANEGAKPIEAIYVFPGSTRAAVHGMRMKIGSRTIEADIQEREEARKNYEAAKERGQRASLLEQERPNVFTMNVANIMPGDRIEVELDYSELLVPENAVYEFVYPTVVGPRYGGGADASKDDWISNPYLTEGKGEPYKFGLAARLETGIGIKELASPSHKVNVNYASPSSAEVTLAEPGGGNRDFVLRYRLAGDKVETGLLLFEDGRESFFLLMMEPPQRPKNEDIPSREYIFVMDVSGSMGGFPIETSKKVLTDLVGNLRPSDYMNIVLFAGTSATMVPTGSIPATKANLDAAIAFIDAQQGGGGTELMAALQATYAIPKARPDLSRTVVVVTDGYVGVEAQAFKFIRDNLNQANLFAFGIGSSVNRALIEGMARAGMGEPLVVLDPSQAAAKGDKFREYIQFPVLAGIGVKFEGLDAVEVAPRVLPDLMAQRPLILFGKYKGKAGGAIRITGTTGRGAWSQDVAFTAAAVAEKNSPIRSLWARKWVEILEDQFAVLPGDPEIKGAITALGLNYSLLTPFTSFVAIDSEVVNKGGGSDKVKQPLPLPQGVEDTAVGEAAAQGMGGAMAPVTAAMPSMAPPPPMSPSPGRMKSVAAADEDEKKAEVVPMLMTTKIVPAGVGDTSALVAVVEAKARPILSGHGQSIELVLKLDASGKVVEVKISRSSGDAKLDAALKAALLGLTSATKPSAATGTVTIELRTT